MIAPRYDHGKPLLDAYLPATLDEPLYTADGQIHDEVYEYGSFLQSKMAKQGPSLLRLPRSALARDSVPTATRSAPPVTIRPDPAARAGIDTSGLRKKKYDDPEHHFHQPGAPGSRCVDCHAPEKRYMVVDPRADHSFRIPRPGSDDGAGCSECVQRLSRGQDLRVGGRSDSRACRGLRAERHTTPPRLPRDATASRAPCVSWPRRWRTNERPPIVRATASRAARALPGRDRRPALRRWAS